MSQEVKKFYDEFADRQVRDGIHRRHLRIMDWVRRFGLRDTANVLEIGCGVGTQTELLAAALPNGKLLANDISPRSVELARKRLAGSKHVEFAEGDIVQLPIQGRFDMIVLPDVLEHIPMAGHGELIRKLAALLSPEGSIVIHIPAPQYLDYHHKYHPEQLQVIDQPLHLAILAPLIGQAGLYLHYVEHYSLWTDGPDAAVFVLKHYRSELPFNAVPPEVGLIGRLRRRFAHFRGRDH